jgi:hypothetical protein
VLVLVLDPVAEKATKGEVPRSRFLLVRRGLGPARSEIGTSTIVTIED